MDVRFTLVLTAALAFATGDFDVSYFHAAQQPAPAAASLPAGAGLPAATPQTTTAGPPPGTAQPAPASLASASQPAAASATPAPRPASKQPLQPESQLLLTRYVGGEFAKAMQPIPGGKKGFKFPVGKPLDSQSLRDALRLWGTAAAAGDTVQITKLVFRPSEILVEINGGGEKHFHLRDHLQGGVGMGNAQVAPPQTSHPNEGIGGMLILDYGHAVPDMSPDDLKNDLSLLLDFSKQHSAAVSWVETLPPQYQVAVKDHRAVVGMDHEMVLAAVGRPDKKVRERDADGNETEDWIYGVPPAPTTFVTFVGDTVIRVKQFD
jgi:hypothetical protein